MFFCQGSPLPKASSPPSKCKQFCTSTVLSGHRAPRELRASVHNLVLQASCHRPGNYSRQTSDKLPRETRALARVCALSAKGYLSHLSVTDICVKSLSQALSLLSARSVYHPSQAPTEIYQPKFDALFHGPLCHDFNQITKAKKAFATNNVALQVFTLIMGHRSWVGPHRFSGFDRF